MNTPFKPRPPFRGGRPPRNFQPEEAHKINNRITAREVRVVIDGGDQLGILSISEAIRKAEELGLDLVEVAPEAKPPVCKIMDFGRYKYEAKKKVQTARKNQKTSVLKEIKLRPVISDHDLQIKSKQIIKFLSDGSKVKISLKFKGREITHEELGFKILDKIKTEVQSYAKIDSEPKFEGKQLIMLLSPAAKK